MYTAVLMMALTTGVDLPDGHRGGGCCGCYGGGGHGRRGGGCCGCYGGYAYGGCYGGGYGGCYGGGYSIGYGGCYGGGIGYGGCYGGIGYGGGCYGGGINYGVGGYGIGGGVIMPGTGTSGEKIQSKPKEKGKETMAPTPATIVVDLPADATLLIDNEATTSTGSSRVFTSPALNPGQEYHYTLKAEVVRDGKSVQAEKVIAVKAGELTPVSLTLPVAGVAQR